MEQEVTSSGESNKSLANNLADKVAKLGNHVKDMAKVVLDKKLGSSPLDGSESQSLLIAHQPSVTQSYGSVSQQNVFKQESPPLATIPAIVNETNNTVLLPLPETENGNVRKYEDLPLIHVEKTNNYLSVDLLYQNNDNNSNQFSGLLTSSVSRSPLPSPAGTDFQGASNVETSKKFSIRRNIKIVVIAAIFIAIAGIITATSETVIRFSQISTSSNQPYKLPLQFLLTFSPWYPILTLVVKGAFVPPEYENITSDYLIIDIEKTDDFGDVQVVSHKWKIPILTTNSIAIPETQRHHKFNLQSLNWRDGEHVIAFRTNSEANVPLSISVKLFARFVENGAIFGGLVILALYILIVFELVNRTLSAMLAASAAIGILALCDERPTTEEMVSWLDMETLILLFSMMVIVSIFSDTGFFDYCAYLMYKVTDGKVWPMIISLCFFTALVSAFLDNVTTILLMTPVTIRICEAMGLNPVPVLISTVIFSNIGGAVTPVGDPPNVIIANNPDIKQKGIDFATFFLHMVIGIVPVMIIAFIQLRFTFRSMKSLQFSEPYSVAELRREIEVWSRAADSLSSYSKDESHVKELLLAKVDHLRKRLKEKIRRGGQTMEAYKANLEELAQNCQIRDWILLIKCGFVLTTVILLFFLHSIPQLNLSLGWTALLGAVLLLILADKRELEGIFTRVEWSTLIFFSALFIVMEAVSRLGLLEWIGNQTEEIILNVSPDSRLTVAILIILWVSGIASAFIDNIPFTTMMVRIVVRVAFDVGLPLQPLVWALAFGTCLGGNGTLIGASANVVCAGVADQHGYRFTFVEYFKIGFPITIVSLIVSSFYLMICHSWLEWNA